MDTSRLLKINQINLDASEQEIESAHQVLRVCENTFPLYYLEPLMTAAKIDKILSEKVKMSYQMERTAIDAFETGDTQRGYNLLEEAALKRKALYTEKNKAAGVLKKIKELKSIQRHMDSLGKRASRRKKRLSFHKNT
jgi:hypothetical protein